MLIQVITGTTRAERFSERVAAWVLEHLHCGTPCTTTQVSELPLSAPTTAP